jgi:hypothetical protein
MHTVELQKGEEVQGMLLARRAFSLWSWIHGRIDPATVRGVKYCAIPLISSQLKLTGSSFALCLQGGSPGDMSMFDDLDIQGYEEHGQRLDPAIMPVLLEGLEMPASCPSAPPMYGWWGG